LEAAGEARRADVAGVAERRPKLDDAGGDGGVPWERSSSKVVGEVGGEEILEPAKSDEDETAALAQVAGGHRLRHQRGRLRDADSGGDEEVLVEAAAVAVFLEASLEPVEAGTNELHRKTPVGMLRVCSREFRQRLRGAVDRAVGVAEHVDRGGGEVCCADTLGEDG